MCSDWTRELSCCDGIYQPTFFFRWKRKGGGGGGRGIASAGVVVTSGAACGTERTGRSFWPEQASSLLPTFLPAGTLTLSPRWASGVHAHSGGWKEDLWAFAKACSSMPTAAATPPNCELAACKVGTQHPPTRPHHCRGLLPPHPTHKYAQDRATGYKLYALPEPNGSVLWTHFVHGTFYQVHGGGGGGGMDGLDGWGGVGWGGVRWGGAQRGGGWWWCVHVCGSPSSSGREPQPPQMCGFGVRLVCLGTHGGADGGRSGRNTSADNPPCHPPSWTNTEASLTIPALVCQPMDLRHFPFDSFDLTAVLEVVHTYSTLLYCGILWVRRTPPPAAARVRLCMPAGGHRCLLRPSRVAPCVPAAHASPSAAAARPAVPGHCPASAPGGDRAHQQRRAGAVHVSRE